MKESPLNFGALGLGLGKNLLKGFKNRKEYGGGLKGMAQATAAQATGEHTDNKLDTIISKLDELSEADTDPSTTEPEDVNMAPQPPQQITSPLNFTEFMKTIPQDPSTNGTAGGGMSVFPPNSANTMMAVADPNTDTKNSLFKQSKI